jgi:chorismate-pyruvate lyase
MGPAGPIPYSSIPPLLRLLLVTDGTVTKSLEALFNIPIQIVVQRQELLAATDVNKYPACELNSQQLLMRDVTLVRTDSHQLMAQAHSMIALDLLPADLAAGLLAGQLGIGELIRSQGLDTYRQLVDVGVSRREDALGIWRRYAICKQGLVLMQVEEWFPWTVYAAAM